MKVSMRCVRWVGAVAIAVVSTIGPVDGVAAQGRGRDLPAPGAGSEGRVSPAELQRLFDAYVVMQAQQELELSDEQYPRFLTRVKTLQDIRRRALLERTRILQELRRLSQDKASDEGQTRGALKRLADLEARTASEVGAAIESVDQVLDVRQQARFRVFEEQMERRKIELLLRARQTNRQR